jgi:preprotein translocase subunit SecE
MGFNPAVWISESKQFLTEVRSEFRKVTWPTQKEAMAGTIGVLVVVAVLTTGLSLVDFGLAQLIQLILPTK